MPTALIKYGLWLSGTIAVLLIVWYLWGSTGTPPGQPPLTSLTPSNLDHFKRDFNGATNEVFRLFVVWEPMLPTDWSRPSRMVQSRISDSHVVQYWDKGHLVARELREQLSAEPSCCQRQGILWDLAALYGKQGQWGNSPPWFANGPVVDAAPTLAKGLTEPSGNNTGDQE
jgi:hypothetical protein